MNYNLTETLQNISLEFSVPGYVVILFGLLSISLAFFYYRFSVPPISKFVKSSLIILRSFSLFLILLLLSELIISLAFSEEKKSINYFFLDTSKSITASDSLERSNDIINLIKELKTDSLHFKAYTFGSKVKQTDFDSLALSKFENNTTNFENIFKILANSPNEIASATIISDGIINSGLNPLYKTENLNFPVFTVGVGDINSTEDVELQRVNFNEYIYLNKQTTFEVGVMNSRDQSTPSFIELFDNNILLSTHKVNLAKKSFSKFELVYNPSSVGVKNLTVRLNGFSGEQNLTNNEKSFVINVLTDKFKIGFISSAPSSDYSMMMNVLKNNEKYEVINYTLSSENKTIINRELSELENVSALVISGFPTNKTPDNIVVKIKQLLEQNKIPYLFQLTNSVNMTKLKTLESVLPFKIMDALPERGRRLTRLRSSHSLSVNLGTLSDYEKLPPIHLSNWDIETASSCLTLLEGTDNSPDKPEPIIVTSTNTNKSVSIFAYNFWKWKLQYQDEFFFDQFFTNIIAWTHTDSDTKRLNLSFDKKTFNLGEKIAPIVKFYDDLLQPINDSEVTVSFSTQNDTTRIILDNNGNGKYSSSINDLKPGLYNFRARARTKNGVWLEDSKEIIVKTVSAEFLENKMNSQLLSGLAHATQGKFYYIGNTAGLKKHLVDNPLNKTYSKINEKRINPLFNYFYLWLLITLFSLEWLIRKRVGLN